MRATFTVPHVEGIILVLAGKIQKLLDTSPTESAMLEPDSPTNAGGGDPDKQGGALVISAKAKVRKKMMP